MVGLANASATLAANGNDLDQSIAILTAANTSLQNINKASTAVRTITARISNSKADLEEMGESTEGLADSVYKYREEVLALTGIDITDANGGLKSTYDILDEIASKWGDIQAAGNTAAVATLLAGTRQQEVFYSIIDNWSEAEEVIKKIGESSGTLDQAYSTYADSIEGRLNTLKATIQDIGRELFESETFKSVITIATDLIEGLAPAFDVLGEIMGAAIEPIGAIVSGLNDLNLIIPAIVVGIAAVNFSSFTKGIANYLSLAGNVGATMEDISTAYAALGPIGKATVANLNATGVATGTLTGKMSILGTAAKSAASSFTAFLGTPIGAITALSAAMIGIVALAGSFEGRLRNAAADSKNSYEEAVTELEAVDNELQTVKARIEELNALENPTFAEQEELGKLQEISAELQNQLELKQALANVEAKEANDSAVKLFEWNTTRETVRGSNGAAIDTVYHTPVTDLEDKIAEYESYQKQVADAQTAYEEAVLAEDSDLIDKTERNLTKLTTLYDDCYAEIVKDAQDLEDSYGAITDGDIADSIKNVQDKVQSVISSYKTEDTAESTQGTEVSEEDQLAAIQAKVNAVKDQHDQIGKYVSEVKSLESELRNYMNLYGGTVDLINRKPVEVTGDNFDAVSTWDTGEAIGDQITMASQTYRDENVALVVTPVLPDGSVMTQDELDDYVSDVIEKTTNGNYAANDEKGILMGIFNEEEWEDNLESANSFSDHISKIHNTILNTKDSLNAALSDFGSGLDISDLSEIASMFSTAVDTVAAEAELVSKALSEQQSGTLSLDTYRELIEANEEYSSCLEWNGSALVLNADKARALQESLNNTTKAELEAAKAAAQQKYAQNATEIAMLASQYGNLTAAGRARLEQLREENSVLSNSITEYQLLTDELEYATSAYKGWLDAQSTQDGVIYDGAQSMYDKLREGLKSGATGQDDFVAAAEFLIPQDVLDKGVTAYSKYLDNIKKYLQDGVKGMQSFLTSAQAKGLMSVDDEGMWTVNPDVKTEDFVEKMHITRDFALAIFQELEEMYGFEFDFADEDPNAQFERTGEILAELIQKKKEYNELSSKKDLDMIERNTLDKTGDAIDDLMDQLDSMPDEVLTQYKLTFDSQTGELLMNGVSIDANLSDLEAAQGILSEISVIEEQIRTLDPIHPDKDGMLAAYNTELQTLYASLYNLPAEVQTALGVSVTFDEATQTYIYDGVNLNVNADMTEATDGFATYSTQVDTWIGGDHTFTVDANTSLATQKISSLKSSLPKSHTFYIYEKTIQVPSDAGGGKKGPVKLHGTANARGSWGAPRTEIALGGEVGPEIQVNSRTGTWRTIGDRGAEFFKVNRGDIIFNAEQTKQLLKNGRINSRGRSYLNGTAYLGGGGTLYVGGEVWKPSSSTSNKKKNNNNKKNNNKSSSEFEKAYAKHQHLLAMEQETLAEYLAWLESAYKAAYKAGKIELEDYYKYEEEVYEKRKELFDDYLSDTEHAISLLENYNYTEAQMVKTYQTAMGKIEGEIARLRKAGLTDSDEAIQTLQAQWWDYAHAVDDIYAETTENAKDATEELVDFRIDMIKEELNARKDALSEELNELKEFYERQKELLHEEADEEDYLDEQAKKRKAVSDLRMELNRLEADDSAWSNARQLELAEELAEAEADLNKFERDHAISEAEDYYDSLYEEQEAAKQAAIDAIDEELNNAKALYDQALADVKNGSAALYREMIAYNNQYGSGIKQDITDMWNAAYEALYNYKKLYGSSYEGFKLSNSGGYDIVKNPSDAGSKSYSTTQSNNNKNNNEGSSSGGFKSYQAKVNAKSGLNVRNGPGTSYKVKKALVNGTKIKIVEEKNGWGRLSSGGWVYLQHVKKYAIGTSHAAGGLSIVNEKGQELILSQPSKGNYAWLENGDKVFNSKAAQFLYEFANDPSGALVNYLRKSMSSRSTVNSSAGNPISIRTGDINVSGNADQRTVSEIRRAQREHIEDLLKELKRLK